MTPLCELALKYHTDKGGNHLLAGQTCHNYTTAYHMLWHARRTDVRRVLEVGVNTGASLRMWEEYFPNAKIVGFDNELSCLFTAGSIACYYADQSSEPSLMHAMAQAGPQLYDFIVDDGSHQTEHQIVTARTLLPLLKEGGLYVIEDFSSEAALLRVREAIPVGFKTYILDCPGSIGPRPFLDKLLVICH